LGKSSRGQINFLRPVIGVAGFCSPDEDSGKLALVLSGSEIRSGQVSVESLWLLLPPLTHATPERCVGRSMTARGAEHFRRVVLGTASGLLCCSSPRIRMLAGGEGPGGILFRDFAAAYLIGSVSLAIILFDGGLRTDPGASSPRCFCRASGRRFDPIGAALISI
jgi:hypothetical protein